MNVKLYIAACEAVPIESDEGVKHRYEVVLRGLFAPAELSKLTSMVGDDGVLNLKAAPPNGKQ